MNFEQAKELSFLVKWKAVECFSGPQCWCRIIVPVEPILYNHPENPDNKHEYSIVDAGSIDQQTAEYIVRLHNEDYERVKQSCKEMMKELTNNIVPLDFDIEPVRTIYRKEID